MIEWWLTYTGLPPKFKTALQLYMDDFVKYLYPLLDSSFKTSSKLSMPLYSIPVTIPSGFDKVTLSMPLSITTYTWNNDVLLLPTKVHTEGKWL